MHPISVSPGSTSTRKQTYITTRLIFEWWPGTESNRRHKIFSPGIPGIGHPTPAVTPPAITFDRNPFQRQFEALPERAAGPELKWLLQAVIGVLEDCNSARLEFGIRIRG
ncbi:MAG: hypothetical protein JWN13_2607 [Betaproteobacteria bacterium]|nr:hypothetical protein [Betaproteobacteria bacterium]